MSRCLVFVAMLSVLAVGCVPKEYGDIQAPFDRKAQVIGDWKAIRVLQIDEQEERPEFKTYDLTNKFDFSQLSISLKADGTFSITSSGAPQFISRATSGTWAFDDQARPSKIIFVSGSSSDTLGLSNLNELTESGRFNVKFTRSVKLKPSDAKPTPILSYQYAFTKK